MVKHLISLLDLQQGDFLSLVERSAQISCKDAAYSSNLRSRCVGLYFKKTSTRTRTSFAVAALRMGATPLVYGPDDLQLNTGESLEDTANILSYYLDALVIRTASDPSEIRAMVTTSRIPIINAMTADEHPTQAISDFAMLRRHFGQLRGLRMIYIGEGNNTALSLAYAAARTEGFSLHLITPKGYGLSEHELATAQLLSNKFGGEITQAHDPKDFIKGGDAVYSTRWQTTGTAKSDPNWRKAFDGFRVTEDVFNRLSRGKQAVFMHDLPAIRGEDTDSCILDGPQSIAFLQAEQKLFTAMAIYEWCLSGPEF